MTVSRSLSVAECLAPHSPLFRPCLATCRCILLLGTRLYSDNYFNPIADSGSLLVPIVRPMDIFVMHVTFTVKTGSGERRPGLAAVFFVKFNQKRMLQAFPRLFQNSTADQKVVIIGLGPTTNMIRL